LILAKELGDRPSEAKVLWNLQLVNLLQNKALEAIGYGEKSLSIARELNLREQMAYVLSDLGWAYIVACQFDQADKHIEEGASLWRELGNLPMLSNNIILSLFGLFWTGKNEEVLRVAEESYQLSASIKEVWNQALARNFQGLVQIDYGDIDQGLATLEESVRLAAQGNPVYELWYGAILLQVYGELGATDLVMDRYRTLRVANQDVPHTPARSGTLLAYALYELSSGQLEAATNTLNDCTPDAIPWETLYRIAKGRLALARADFTAAVALADSAVDLARQNKLGHHLPEALFLKGKAYFCLGDLQEAKNALEEALTAAEKLGSRYLLWQIIAILAEIETDQERSIKLKAEARQIVDYIADHITRKDLHEAFLRFAGVSVVLT
jgi:tetratricopeptide (TPR) repeat protein